MDADDEKSNAGREYFGEIYF
ncbi:hypothetical protein Rmet_6726 (plasmid) [Cupriavidus metallidurans CH34]|uniref:Uncharacterized protein n=1 Tax=Cupriavidus metallidurans (strain ATCC 43123 / DSM 2839 / NBRC 102507 / CH34) TaxID=266264 RepID=D3DYD5_CUPMC|nr:hypothetical protein Rmet_6726 [Cupriavidus metallidurans CH34]